MWKVKKWIEKHTASRKEYEEEKREFKMAIGKPFITLKIELPDGFEDQRLTFLKLEEDCDFIDEVCDQVKKNLLIKKEEKKASSKEEETNNSKNYENHQN